MDEIRSRVEWLREEVVLHVADQYEEVTGVSTPSHFTPGYRMSVDTELMGTELSIVWSVDV